MNLSSKQLKEMRIISNFTCSLIKTNAPPPSLLPKQKRKKALDPEITKEIS